MRLPPAILAITLAAAISFCAGCEAFGPLEQKQDSQAWSIVHAADGFDLDRPGDAWTFRTPELWRIVAAADRRFLQMAYPPDRPMLPGVRRPQEYAVYNKFEFRSFALACYVRIDRGAAVRGRDACIIFGRRDDTHFYYAHLSGFSDTWHNNLIRVDGTTRLSLLPPDPARRPAITDQNWHLVDVMRDCDAGTIKVYVDRDKGGENASPLFEVHDRTYEWGFVALGSFDDHASFGRFAIEGQARPAGSQTLADRPPATTAPN
ncbi:MAG TPA: hypothetical protein VLM89_01715 [Phycisphaerae bacterium]|nr:hypothetical protein [Phycisphaerae bacterium]